MGERVEGRLARVAAATQALSYGTKNGHGPWKICRIFRSADAMQNFLRQQSRFATVGDLEILNDRQEATRKFSMHAPRLAAARCADQ